MGWLDLLAVQGTLKSLLQHHSSKASILWPSAFSMVHVCMDLLGGNEQEKCSVRHRAAGGPQFEAGDVAGGKEQGAVGAYY